MSTDPEQLLSAAAQMLDAAGVGLEDLRAHLEARRDDAGAAGYPTLAEHVATFEAALPANTRRTWATHYRRLLDGVAPQCECTCDACLDLTAGCSCGCASCAEKLGIEACGDRVLRPRAVSASEVRRWAVVAQRLSVKRATATNRRRAERGQAPLPAHGHGGRENAVTAYRALFAALLDDELWDTNPAAKVTKPKRNDTRRRAMRDDELVEFLRSVAAGGDDPDLDVLLCWFHLETGARRGGAVSLTLGALHRVTQSVELFEKGAKLGDQPVSAELLDALFAHAAARGGPACDPHHPAYDPSRPVFYYRHPDRGRVRDGAAPLSARRYDTLFRRVRRDLGWADEISLSAHALRKTAASAIERLAGSQTARLFLRHGRRSTTDTYVESWLERLAEAIVIRNGRPHPMAPDASRRLATAGTGPAR